MIARRLVTTLALLALVSNVCVFAVPSARAKAQAFALVSLKHETEGALTRILIESSAPPLYTVFRPTDRLVVVDLPGGEVSHLAPEYNVRSALVDSIMVRQSRVGGGATARSVARVEVNIHPDARDRSTVNGNTLVLEISPTGKVAPAVSKNDKNASSAPEAKEAKPASHSPANGRVATPGVEVYSVPVGSKSTEPAVEKVKPQPIDLKPATVIRAVRSEVFDAAFRLVVDADGAAQYKDFVLQNPWRIVVDVNGVRSVVGNK